MLASCLLDKTLSLSNPFISLTVASDQEAYTKSRKSRYTRVISTLWWERWRYRTYTTLAVALVILQLGLGITVSVLTSQYGGRARTAVIILGAVNSFVGGLAGILQYRGQPSRSARYVQALDDLQDDIDRVVGNLKNPSDKDDPEAEADALMDAYKQARRERFSNDPLVYDKMIPPGPSRQPLPPQSGETDHTSKRKPTAGAQTSGQHQQHPTTGTETDHRSEEAEHEHATSMSGAVGARPLPKVENTATGDVLPASSDSDNTRPENTRPADTNSENTQTESTPAVDTRAEDVLSRQK